VSWDPGCPRRVVAIVARTIALAAGVLALAGASDTARDDSQPCRSATVGVRVYEGSRLFDAPGKRLDLVPGRGLGCGDARVRRVLDALGAALLEFPRQRLHEPLKVHLDPRLPARHAPLAAIEVHVTSREVLVTSAALATLAPEVWRHEVLHTLAAPPPQTSAEARRLWLTLEEGVVGYLTGATEDRQAPGATDRRRSAANESMTRVLPLLEWLGSPAYDPHPLAAGLTRQLTRVTPRAPLEPWLDCLAAEPAERTADSSPAGTSGTFTAPLPDALAAVFRAFIGRCSADVQATLSTAVAGWWGEPPTGRPLAPRPLTARRPIDGRQPGKAAASSPESR
jgi:hypothetical protein